MYTIKRIEAVSAMRVGALVSGLIFTIFGLIFFGLQSALLNIVSTSLSQQSSRGNIPTGGIMAAGLAGFCIFYVAGVIFSAIMGGIYGAVGAFIYNLVSNWVGGIRVELDNNLLEKSKREVVVGQPPSSPASF